MYCEYCYGILAHDPRCPLYKSPRSSGYCSICKEEIYNGEEYIENDNGECAHWECVDYGRDLVRFLGYDIKEMED